MGGRRADYENRKRRKLVSRIDAEKLMNIIRHEGREDIDCTKRDKSREKGEGEKGRPEKGTRAPRSRVDLSESRARGKAPVGCHGTGSETGCMEPGLNYLN